MVSHMKKVSFSVICASALVLSACSTDRNQENNARTGGTNSDSSISTTQTTKPNGELRDSASTSSVEIEIDSIERRTTLLPVDQELTPGMTVGTAQASSGSIFFVVHVDVENKGTRALIPNDIIAQVEDQDGNIYSSYADAQYYVPREAGHFLAADEDLDTAFIFEIPENAQIQSLLFTDAEGNSGEIPLR